MFLHCAVFAVALSVYSLWLWRRWKAALTKFRPLLPPSNQLSWKKPKGAPQGKQVALAAAGAVAVGDAELVDGDEQIAARGSLDSAGHSFPTAAFSASLDGAVVGFSAVEAFSHIDTDVLKAIQFSTADHLHSLPSIDEYAQAHFSGSVASAEGWLHRLEGYVAEQKAAMAFEQAGHVVQFAPTANNAGWDLLVDGHPWQVKEGVDVAGIKDALANHSDIPIATGTDLAEHVHAPMVQGFHALDHHAIASTTKESLAGVKEGFHPGLKIPVVTIAFSSWREFKLLLDDKTTWDRALKSVAIDAVGVGAGMTAGAKLGALAGAWLGPLGAGAGALIGGIGGALAGRGVSHAIRFKGFNRAYEAYQAEYAQARTAVDCSIAVSRDRVQALKREYQQRYLTVRAEIEAEVRAELERLDTARQSELDRFADRFPKYLEELLQQLRTEERQVLASMPSSRWWGFIAPGEIELHRIAVHRWFLKAGRRVHQEMSRYSQLASGPGIGRNTEIRRFLTEYCFELHTLEEHLALLARRSDELRVQAESTRDAAVSRTVIVRNDLIREFGQKVTAIHAGVASTISTWCRGLKQAQAAVRREARPLGIKLPTS